MKTTFWEILTEMKKATSSLRKTLMDTETKMEMKLIREGT